MFQIRRTTEGLFVGPQAFSLLYDAHLVTLNETRKCHNSRRLRHFNHEKNIPNYKHYSAVCFTSLLDDIINE